MQSTNHPNISFLQMNLIVVSINLKIVYCILISMTAYLRFLLHSPSIRITYAWSLCNIWYQVAKGNPISIELIVIHRIKYSIYTTTSLFRNHLQFDFSRGTFCLEHKRKANTPIWNRHWMFIIRYMQDNQVRQSNWLVSIICECKLNFKEFLSVWRKHKRLLFIWIIKDLNNDCPTF
jgi:hypothetical protein